MDEARKDEGLQALGAETTYRTDYAPEVLETFLNKHPDNDYWVQFNCCLLYTSDAADEL